MESRLTVKYRLISLLVILAALSQASQANAQQAIGGACPTVGWTTIQPNQIVYCNTSSVWALGEEITSAGNVGIGTTAPATALDIVRTQRGGLGPELRLENNGYAASDAAQISFSDGGTVLASLLWKVVPGGDESWNFYDAIAGTTRLFIADNTGNVGIGTSSPAASLDLSQKTDALALPVGSINQRPSSPVNGMLRYNSTTTPALEAYVNGAWTALSSGGGSAINLGTSAGVTNPQKTGDATTGLFSSVPSTIQFATSGVERVRVDGSGNVEIGTTTPQSNYLITAIGGLYESSASSAAGIYAINTSTASPSGVVGELKGAGNTGAAVYGINDPTTSAGINYGGLFATNSTGAAYGVWGQESGAGNTGAGGYFLNAGGGSATNFGVYATTNSTGAGAGVYAAETGSANTGAALYVSNASTTGWSIFSSGSSPSYLAGKVGIGTNLPANALDVNGGLAIGTYAGLSAGANNMIVGGNVSIGTSSAIWPFMVAKTAPGKGIYVDDTSGSTSPHDFAQDIEVYNVVGSLTDYRGGLRVHIDPSNTTASTGLLVGVAIGAHANNAIGLGVTADGNASSGITNYSRGTIGYFQTTGQPSGTDGTIGMQLNHQSSANALNIFQQYSTMTGDFIYINAKNAGSGSFTGNFLNFNSNGVPKLLLNSAGNLSAAGTILTQTGFSVANNIPYILGTSNQAAIYDDGTNAVINPRISGSGNLIVPVGNVGIGTNSPQATLDVAGYMRLAKNSSQPTSCSSSNDGAIALTHLYTLCICNGGSANWVQDNNGTSICSW